MGAHILVAGQPAMTGALAADLAETAAVVTAPIELTLAMVESTAPEVIVMVVEADATDAEARRGTMRLLAQLASNPALRCIPVLTLVPPDDGIGLVTVLALGAADCATLPLLPGELAARVGALLRRRSAADRLAEVHAEVSRQATVDAVTGVFNRHYLDSSLAAALIQHRAATAPLALLMIDIDSFKPINDLHGHAMGDRALAAVAAKLVENVRATDTVARYGGDELVILMPQTEIETARHVAERLRCAVAEMRVDAGIGVTVSVGVAVLMPGDHDGSALLARADAALYAAKRAGRNTIAEAA